MECVSTLSNFIMIDTLSLLQEQKFDLTDFQGSPIYELTQNSAVKNEKRYACCVEPYYDLTWTLGLKKKDDKAATCDAAPVTTSSQE